MGSDIKLFRIDNLSGGRNTRDARNVVEPSQSPDDLNMQWDRLGRITRRPGFRLHLNDQYSDPVRGLFRFVIRGGNKYLMVAVGDTLYAYRGSSPTYDKLIVREDLTSSIERYFAQMQDNCYVSSYNEPTSATNKTTWNVDSPFRWNASEYTTMGHEQFGEAVSGSISSAASATGGSMVFTGSAGTEYVYAFVNCYAGLGDGPVAIDADEWGYENVVDPGAGAVTAGSVAFTGLAALTDPKATTVKIYRTLNAVSNNGSTSAMYFIAEIEAGDDAYTDTKNDNDLVSLLPEQPIFDRARFPKFRYIAVHKSRTFIANCFVPRYDSTYDAWTFDRQASRLYWSDLYQPDRIMGFVDVGSDRDQITQIVSFNNTLVVFKDSSVHVLYGNGPSDFQVREANPAYGCIAPRSPAVLYNNLVFLSSDREWVAYDGVSFKVMSEAIRNDLRALTDSRLAESAGGVNDGRFHGAVPRE